MEPVLRVENLTKKYKDVTAVDHISFDIEKGEIVGLLGPNGAGKSTTIQMLLGLLEPTEGNITIFGKSLKEKREEILQEMNFAAAYSMLPYNLTPEENLKIFALMYGIKDYKKRTQSLLEEFDLVQLKNNRSGSLSSGEQMRLALAKAFLNNPRLLLLDEPTASLDPAVARELRSKIYHQAKETEGTILWTSHNMREIETMCNRVIFLSHGKIVANNTPDNLKKQFKENDLEEIFISLAKEKP